MSIELEKAYDPQKSESTIYQQWERSGLFNPDKKKSTKKPFVISMPPPNVTGELHLGHATGMTLQDIMIRYARMQGRPALWVPGTDHAGIATQIMVERLIAKEGLNRHAIGRDAFLSRVWKWKEQYGSSIITQIKQLGASCDWSREAFTMDEDRTLAVRTAFTELYNRGLIYRGKRIISWCPRCQSAISDLEVKYVETNGTLYTIRYPLVGSTKYLTIATTRPETMLGDMAVAVHPEDPRYKKFIGKKVVLPIVEREIPIIADRAVERTFGTGAVKVTPAHDMIDFEIGQRHNLPTLQVIDETAHLTKEAGAYYGMHTQDARREILATLEKDGHLDSSINYLHNVAHCDRCGTVIEPLISEQWFMRMEPLAKPALEAVAKKKIRIVPERFGKVYRHWLTNIHDWTLSRQLWWGHQIPVWYCDTCGKTHPIVAVKTPTHCPQCKGKKLTQDQDTLDTWFSSGLWTFSTLGWPRATKDLKKFHPTSVMETGWDILFFWVARMVMLSLALTKKVPFTTIYLHGLVLDKDGKKMSKSKGTGIDPIPMAKTYGTDAIRLSLVLGTAAGLDFRLTENKIAYHRNFINKVWNIGRFIAQQPTSQKPAKVTTLADAWIMSRLARVKTSASAALEEFRFSDGGSAVLDFVWHEFADWYIEIAKQEKNYPLVKKIYADVLAILHPFAPFVTEHLWQALSLGGKTHKLLLSAPWPTGGKKNLVAEKNFEKIMQAISAIRMVRNITKTPPHKKMDITIQGKNAHIIIAHAGIISSLAGIGKITSTKTVTPTIVLSGLRIALPLDTQAHALLERSKRELQMHRDRLTGLLSKQSFRDKAPATVIAENEKKLHEILEQLTHLGK